ncbi:TIGR04376 family protein [Neosynechococcus sphagnicola]|uniref:TIGR04376 family protein n=1 Tax=Neosynechococcus sphagnicola TaxID=1501145 RepID=UPI000A4D14A2|nr:TIGR04376 family protein [Neosynechococcus sphagnicola]
MGLFEDLSQFLERRLEEFLRENPHLALQALEEKLREQETETQELIADLKQQQQQSQAEILAIAQEIQRWHTRVDKARAAGRVDLAEAAQERESALLREGNQRWGQMEMLGERLRQAEELHRKITARRQEVGTKVAQVVANQASTAQHQGAASSWDRPFNPPAQPARPLRRKI